MLHQSICLAASSASLRACLLHLAGKQPDPHIHHTRMGNMMGSLTLLPFLGLLGPPGGVAGPPVPKARRWLAGPSFSGVGGV